MAENRQLLFFWPVIFGGADERRSRTSFTCFRRVLVPEPGRTEVRAPRLLASAGSLFRSREEQKFAHLAHRIAGDGTLARPREYLVHISGFQYPKNAYVLLGLQVGLVGDENRAVGLLPHRLGVGGRGNAAGELPHAGSNHFAVERVDLFDHRFGYSGRVEVVGEVVSNQILWHDFFSLVSVVCSR